MVGDGRAQNLKIVRTTEASLPSVNSLIASSKAHWTWPIDYLERALVLHVLNADYLRKNDAFNVLGLRNELVGFFSLLVSDGRIMLDNLWVIPDQIGHGVGRRACQYVFELARERGQKEVWVLPDPPAEGFYLRLGFTDTGERVQSRVPGGPIFCLYRRQIL
ncbi:MAG: GNAT family N-acetyltransferase [Steroidobacteraceae bacterium]